MIARLADRPNIGILGISSKSIDRFGNATLRVSTDAKGLLWADPRHGQLPSLSISSVAMFASAIQRAGERGRVGCIFPVW